MLYTYDQPLKANEKHKVIAIRRPYIIKDTVRKRVKVGMHCIVNTIPSRRKECGKLKRYYPQNDVVNGLSEVLWN